MIVQWPDDKTLLALGRMTWIAMHVEAGIAIFANDLLNDGTWHTEPISTLVKKCVTQLEPFGDDTSDARAWLEGAAQAMKNRDAIVHGVPGVQPGPLDTGRAFDRNVLTYWGRRGDFTTHDVDVSTFAGTTALLEKYTGGQPGVRPEWRLHPPASD